MAPGANIIHLKVFENNRTTFDFPMMSNKRCSGWSENAATYNIASVNMSLGSNRKSQQPEVSLYGLGDELAALAANNVIVVSSSGNVSPLR
jgi:hypothetical protein